MKKIAVLSLALGALACASGSKSLSVGPASGRAVVQRPEGAEAIEFLSLAQTGSHHVTVWAESREAAELALGSYLEDPWSVPRPPEVDVHSIRRVEVHGIFGGCEITEIRCKQRDLMEVTLNGEWLGSLEDGAVEQTWEPELGGVFVTTFSVPFSRLRLGGGGDVTRNALEWTTRDVGEELVGTGFVTVGHE